MMTCPNCGALVHPQAQMCPRCQAQLNSPAPSAQADYPYTGRTDATDNMPAWVRAVQGQAYSQQRNNPSTGALGPGASPAGYPQVPPPQQPQGSLSLSDMINEENLPEWLRGAADAPDAPAQRGGAQSGQNANGYRQQQQGQQAERGAGDGAGFMGTYPAAGYSAYPFDPHPTGNMATPSASSTYSAPPIGSSGASASSLLDESALPDWLRQTSMNGQAGAAPSQQAPGAQPGQGMAAGYPGAQPFPEPEPSSAFPRIDQVAYGQQPASPPDHGMRGGIAAQSLFDPQALPGWLGGAGAMPYTQQQNERGGMGMSAGSLVDEHALPQWLRNEPATPSQRVPAMQPGVVSQWITGASDEPLPTWLNQVYSDAQVAPSPAAPPQVFSPAQPFAGSAGGPGYAQPTEFADAHSQRLPARQFIEESALPEWLRAQGAAPATPSRPAQLPPTTPYTPPYGQPETYSPQGAPVQNMPNMPNMHENGYSAAPPFAAPGDQFTYRSSQPANGYLASNGQANAMGQQPAPAYGANGPARGAQGRQAPTQEPEIAPVATFSALDLIDPDALPSWVQGANGTKSAGATTTRIQASANGANTVSRASSVNGMSSDGGSGSLRRMPATSGWDEETSAPPTISTSRSPATLGQTMTRSGRVPVPPANQANQPSQASSQAPQEWGQPATGRMRLDDPPAGGRNQQNWPTPVRPAPQRQAPQGAPQRAPGTGSLRQPPPEQQLSAGELPSWLRAGARHVAPPEASASYNNGYGAYGVNYGQNNAAGYADDEQDPFWDEAAWGSPAPENPSGQPQQYTGRARAPMQGGRPPAGGISEPDESRKRGWRRIFGR